MTQIPTIPRTVCSNHSRYVTGCDACREASVTRRRITRRLTAYGRWQGFVDTTEARRHAQHLHSQGMSGKAIAAKAGVNHAQVRHLINGTLLRARASTVEAILGVQLQLPDHASVRSLGTARRLQALAAIGWPTEVIAAELGLTPPFVQRARRRYQPTVSFGVHRAVAELYRRIHGQRGPSGAIALYALRQGWAPPIHWDDDGDLDHPKSRAKHFKPRRGAA